MSFTREEIADACREFGPQLAPLPLGVDGAQLLWAISGNESSFGSNTIPRHESAFDYGGVYGDNPVMQPLLAKFGSAAAYSYGPLQLMFTNAPTSYTPDDFNDLGKAFTASVMFLNQLLNRFRPQTLDAIGSCWNSGHIQVIFSPAVQTYVGRLAANYAVIMPSAS